MSPEIAFPDGFLIDDAHAPRTWEPFELGRPSQTTQTVVTIESESTRAVWARPDDKLRTVAPGLLKASCEDLGNGPCALMPGGREAVYRIKALAR